MGTITLQEGSVYAAPSMRELKARRKVLLAGLKLKRSSSGESDACLFQRWANSTNAAAQVLAEKRAELASIQEGMKRVNADLEVFLCTDHTIDQLNLWLIHLGREAQPSITKAKAQFSTIFINIYDLLARHYDRQCVSARALGRYSLKHGLMYPKKLAKGTPVRFLLKHLHLYGR
jgi:hypothetical protein